MLIAGSAGLAFAAGAFPLAGCLLVAGGFFDLVDGVVARHFGISTRFGAFLDSSLDRVVDILVMSGLLVFYVREPSSVGVALCARMPGGLLERGERVGLLAAAAILGFVWPVLWVLAVGTVVTVGQRFLYAYREMTRLDGEEKG